MPWLRDNLLAAYGAVVGTAGVLHSLSRFAYDRRKDRIQLRVARRRTLDFHANVERLARRQTDPFDNPGLLPGYSVTVYNDGFLPLHIADAGLVDRNGARVQALTSRSKRNPMLLGPIGEADLEPISSKSSETFTVYLRAGQSPPDIEQCYVVDKTGRYWKGPHTRD